MYYFWKEISASSQLAIDTKIKAIVKGLDRAIIPGLDLAKLTSGELTRIDKIMKYKIGNLWQRKATKDTTLTLSDEKRINIAGKELIGSNS